nr:hypothetical protein [Tanacetum cinerariifolium]
MMVEPEQPLKKKDQIMIDEEVFRNLEAQLHAELEEEERFARQKEEESNISLVAEWDNVQAMMDVDHELAERLQVEEQGELTIEERSKLFVELMNQRNKHFAPAMMDVDHELAERLQVEEQGGLTIEERSKLFVELMNQRNKHFARLRVEEKRRKLPTKAQKRNQMCTYLKNMPGFTHNQLKNKSFEEVKNAFNKTMSWINSFVSIDSEVVKDRAEGSETKAEGSSKRAGEELEYDKSKRQKLDEKVEAKEDNDQEEAEMKEYEDSF